MSRSWSEPVGRSRRRGLRLARRVVAWTASAAVLIALGGCAAGSTQPATPSPSTTAAAADLKTRLRAGAEKIGQDTFTARLTMSGNTAERAALRVEMEVDPQRRRSTTAIHFPVSQPGHFQWVELKTVGKESWAQFFGFGEPPEGWLPVTVPGLLGDGSALSVGAQVATDLQGLVEMVVELRPVTERVISGTLDLRQHPRLRTGSSDPPATYDVVPFTATLDLQDRVTNLTISWGQTADGGQWQFLYSAFGSHKVIEPPRSTEILDPDDVDPRLLRRVKGMVPR